MYYGDMIYSVILTLHLVGAAVTGLLASYAGVVLWRKSDSAYRPLAIALGSLATFEVVSGTTLSIISIQVSTLSLCANIAAYLLGCVIVETALFVRMQKISVRFPFVITLSPLFLSLLGFAAAIAHGF
jgi:hypothetical protein